MIATSQIAESSFNIADSDGDFITAHAEIAGGMLREEGDNPLTVQDLIGDRAPPVVAGLDFGLVEPDIVPALFQVSLDASDEFLIGGAAVAQENAEGRGRLCVGNLAMGRADPE